MTETYTNSSPSSGVLAGLRVLDLTRVVSGPYCTMMFAEHGAEVIKIENGIGDSSRTIDPFRDDDPEKKWSGYFVSLNCNKKSITLDLKTDEGKDALRYLVKDADILVENFRPNVMEKLGLGYEALAEINPKLIYGSIRGFGDPRFGKSPYSDWPCYDVVTQAMGGIMSFTGKDINNPTKVGPAIGDIFSGMMMAFAIMAALKHRDETGEGQMVDVAMQDAMVSLCERIIYQYDYDKTIYKPEGNMHAFLSPFGVFPVKDGWVAIGIVENNFFDILVTQMGREDLINDERFNSKVNRNKNSDIINKLVEEWTMQYTRAELNEKLGGKIPFGPMNNAEDIFNDEHTEARNLLVDVAHPEGKRPWRIVRNPIKYSKTPAPEPVAPVQMGANNEEILHDFNVWKLGQNKT